MLCPLSGGSAFTGSLAGVWALYLIDVRSASGGPVGFRADLSGYGLHAVVATQPEKGAPFLPSAKSASPLFLVTQVKTRGAS